MKIITILMNFLFGTKRYTIAIHVKKNQFTNIANKSKLFQIT